MGLVTREELEWRLIYALVVAGKSAKFANGVIVRLRNATRKETNDLRSPIDLLAEYPELLGVAGTGRYRILEKALKRLSSMRINLETCSTEELERIPGIGPKTSRFFVARTRPGIRVAILDRHVLRWLRELGIENVPRNTPGSPKVYARLERAFLEEADRRGVTPRELDLKIWLKAATEPNVVGDRVNIEEVKL